VTDIHATYGAAATAIDTDDGPDHDPVVKPATADLYDVAAECIWAASCSHADAAANNDAEPAPEYIRPELISGGSAAKSIAKALL
jgi:succinate dehydrogenase/fumarate reductase-like Fe-S protein